jgi:diaminohydroxyphosphoribosylaminopyrimidine deaminase/5-amino-6-(5-phosphoribosylamino)uracil reductase
LRIPLDSQLVQTAAEVPTIVACAEPDCLQDQKCAALPAHVIPALDAGIIREKEKALAKKGVQVIRCASPSCGHRVDLCLLMKKLGELGLDSVLVEGGGALNFSLLKAGLVQRVYSFVAPKIFGGAAAPSPVAGSGVLEVADAFSLEQIDARKIGSDVLIEYEVVGGKNCSATQGQKSRRQF